MKLATMEKKTSGPGRRLNHSRFKSMVENGAASAVLQHPAAIRPYQQVKTPLWDSLMEIYLR